MPKGTQKDLRLVLVGASGRMGREIVEIAASRGSGFVIVAQLDSAKTWPKSIPTADAWVDFSSDEGLATALDKCVELGVPLVSGTTGLSAKTQKALAKASAKIPVLYSANMSLGIAVLSSMLEALGAVSDWDFQVEEVHHNQKKDRPSGTALLLENRLKKVLGRDLPPTQVIRGGGVPGIHTVWAMGPEETVTLQHTAFHRKVFARGALKAARWLFDKGQPGLYDLSDLYR